MLVSNYAFVAMTQTGICLYNALSGGMCVISKNILPYLTIDGEKLIGVADTLPERIIKRLQAANICDFDANTYLSELEKASAGLDPYSRIGSVRFTLTKACDCRCAYCYVDGKDQGKALEVSDCLNLITTLLSRSKRREIKIRYFGGEPTLEFDRICEIHEESMKIEGVSFPAIVNTNGQGLTEAMALYFAQRDIKIVLSLDSVKSINDQQRVSSNPNGYYEKAVESIKLLKKHGARFVVGSVVTDMNKYHIGEFLRELRDLGVSSVCLNFAKMVDGSVVTYDSESARIILDAWEYGKSNGIAVSGYWYLPFDRMVRGSSHGFCGCLGYELDLRPGNALFSCVGAKKPIGTIESLNAAFSSSLYQSLLTRVPTKITGCEGCSLEGLCAGDCACDAEYHCGSIGTRNESVCRMQKEITLGLLERSFNERRVVAAAE